MSALASQSTARFDACLFDLDGTLIDSIELILQSYEHALRTHGIEPTARAEWVEGLGTPLYVQFRKFTRNDAHVEDLIATYRTFNLAHHDQLVQPYAGIRAALDALRAAGMRLGLVTSKRSDGARRGLAHCGLEGLFEVFVCMDDVTRHKPDPEPVARALELMCVAPERAIYIGDSPHDLVSGRSAGTATGAVLWGPFTRERLARESPDEWFEAPHEFARLATPRRV